MIIKLVGLNPQPVAPPQQHTHLVKDGAVFSSCLSCVRGLALPCENPIRLLVLCDHMCGSGELSARDKKSL
jgi:hypothetical protein